MTPLQKQCENSDLRKTIQILNHMKGFDKSYIQTCTIVFIESKVIGIYVKCWLVLL